ncbi:hypothetical protein [Chryseobacterium balustinum]|uniref:Uncharacterized protein n=1 Tax=Chryseobacterium balustinum TaxID=246 RepID=A0ABY1L493_9FLAO|nr:hypothetical protein [Chryseobacterium balustinum]AZB30921.1 hypothetical protein EB354_17580 [Chryseobacterium balustinum]SKB42627.1 hypothetical protein SAMN05421800_101649 [Chryseobacterium balustinum]
MKKIIPFLMLAFVSIFTVSCDNDDDIVEVPVDYDTYSTAYDIAPNFTRVNSSLYEYVDEFTKPLVESDVVLVYMQTDTTNNGSPIWKLLPYTFFTNNANNDEVDYGFDFSKFDFSITVNSTLNLDTNSSYYTNKKFRVVTVPAKSGKNGGVDYNDYNSVIKFYNIDESKIKFKN